MLTVLQAVRNFLYWTEFAKKFDGLIRSSIEFVGIIVGGSTTFGTPYKPLAVL
jgi:hypothetical protein